MILEKFNMIDKTLSISDAKDKIVCVSRIPEESPVFEGHFPTFPIVPGVLLVEVMAQASSYLSMIRSDFSKMAFLMGVEGARFRDFVKPDREIRSESNLVREGSGYGIYQASLSDNNGILLASGQVRLTKSDFPSTQLKEMLMFKVQESICPAQTTNKQQSLQQEQAIN